MQKNQDKIKVKIIQEFKIRMEEIVEIWEQEELSDKLIL